VLIYEKPTSADKQEEDIYTSREIQKFKVAYIVFEKTTSLKKCLKMRILNPLNGDGQLLTGIEKWVQDYQNRLPDPEEMQDEIEAYMNRFDEETEMSKNKSTDADDDEGWVTVTKDSHNRFTQKEATINKLEERIAKDKKNKQLQDFYTFQIRESKRNEVISLRKKYEQDRRKMDQIKKMRRFKPF
jgi:ribosomal RNA-processing protein 7